MRSSTLSVVACALVAGVAASASGQEPAGTTLSFTEAIDRAEKTPDVDLSEKNVTIARRQLAASKARRWARVDVSANVLFWDEALEFELVPMIPGMMTPEADPLVVRERATYGASVSVVQPVSAQIVFQRAISADEQNLEATEHTHRATKLDIVQGVAETYLRMLQAMAGRDIAQTRVAQLEAQVKRVRVLVEGGLAQRVDVMRLEAALADARQQLLGADAAVVMAGEMLAMLLGLPLDSNIVPVAGLPDQPAPPPVDGKKAADEAEAKQPNLDAAQARARQAYYASRIALVNLYPNLNAVGTYSYNEGQGSLQPEHAWFVGVNLTWTIWDWGNTWKNYKAAVARTEQAQLSAGRQTDQARLAARNAALAARTAYEAIAVARAGLDAAEEAYRIQSARYGEGAATTNDLLDAESDLASARIGAVNVRYAYFIALVRLDRAMGRTPGRSLTAARSK